MKAKNRRRIIVIGTVIGFIILLWLLLRRRPDIVNQIREALGQQPLELGGINIPDRSDISIPPLDWDNDRRYTSCNLCGRIRRVVFPPSTPQPYSVPQADQVTINIMPTVPPTPVPFFPMGRKDSMTTTVIPG